MGGLNYQDMIRALEAYWAERGCVLMQPYHTELGAGTMNPATFLRCLGPKPWRAALVGTVSRAKHRRYGEDPSPLQPSFHYQSVLQPPPPPLLVPYFDSLPHPRCVL